MLVHDCFIFLMDHTLYFIDMVSLSQMIIVQILYFNFSGASVHKWKNQPLYS